MITRVQLQPGYVLHARPYRETSLLLEALSRDHGRVGLVARGAAAPRARLRPRLQPFRPLLLSWTGRGELRTLTGAEEGAPAPVPAGRRTMAGLYLNELLIRLLHRDDPCPDLYALYVRTLAELAAPGDDQAMAMSLRRFEQGLLEALGYGLLLEYDAVAGAPLEPERCYDYRPGVGPVPATGGASHGVPIHGASLLALARGATPTPAQGREIKRLMRALIGQLLEGRPLRSRELFRAAAPPSTGDQT